MQHQVISKSRAMQHLGVWEFTWEGIGEGLKTMAVYMGGLQDIDVNLRHKDRVPRFWVGIGPVSRELEVC